MSVRLIVNINDECAEILRAYGEGHGVSATETVRRFIAIANVVIAADEDGKKVFLCGGGDSCLRLELLV